jgi:hypothetical protein
VNLWSAVVQPHSSPVLPLPAKFLAALDVAFPTLFGRLDRVGQLWIGAESFQ